MARWTTVALHKLVEGRGISKHRIIWDFGDCERGPFALIAWCGAPSISCWLTREAAERRKRNLDLTGCGGRCRFASGHEIVACEGVEEG
jgi:hypothetical protein